MKKEWLVEKGTGIENFLVEVVGDEAVEVGHGLGGEVGVGKADPSDGGSGVERGKNRAAFRRHKDAASLYEEESGCHVVRVANEGARQPELGEGQRAEVGNHAVVPAKKLIDLATRGNILVLKAEGDSGIAIGEEGIPEGFLEGGEQAETSRKKAGDTRETLLKIGGLGG